MKNENYNIIYNNSKKKIIQYKVKLTALVLNIKQ